MVDLNGVQAKLCRAQEHLESVDAELAAFRDCHPYEVVVQTNSDRTEHVIYIDGLAPVPARVSILAGDCLYAMRSALDHLACQLILDNGGVLTFKSAFPIFTSPGKFGKLSKGVPDPRSGLVKIEGCSARVIATIEGLQPYSEISRSVSGPPKFMERLFKRHPLKVLDDFTNFDKHRLLHVAWVRPTNIQIMTSDPSIEVEGGFTTTVGNIKNGAEIARYSTPPLIDPMKVTFGVAVKEVLENEWELMIPNIAGPDSVVERLERCLAATHRVVDALT